MPKLLSVGEAARRIPGANARDITNAFYLQRLESDRCPIIGGRRLIPEEYLPAIEMVLRRAGKLRRASKGVTS